MVEVEKTIKSIDQQARDRWAECRQRQQEARRNWEQRARERDWEDLAWGAQTCLYLLLLLAALCYVEATDENTTGPAAAGTIFLGLIAYVVLKFAGIWDRPVTVGQMVIFDLLRR
jgi:hypothetical protein